MPDIQACSEMGQTKKITDWIRCRCFLATGACAHKREPRIGIACTATAATTRPGGPRPKHQEKGRRSGCSIRTSPTKSIQSKMSSDLMNLIELFGGSLPTLPAKGMESLLQFRRYGCGINVARSRRNRSTGLLTTLAKEVRHWAVKLAMQTYNGPGRRHTPIWAWGQTRPSSEPTSCKKHFHLVHVSHMGPRRRGWWPQPRRAGGRCRLGLGTDSTNLFQDFDCALSHPPKYTNTNVPASAKCVPSSARVVATTS